MDKETPTVKKKIIIILTILCTIIALFLLYGRFISTSGLYIKEYKITNKLVPMSFHGLKIVHFSDLHYGRTIKEKQLKNIVNKINSVNPDIVIFSGDLVDKDVFVSDKTIEILERELSKISAKISKYAITGNHDFKLKKYQSIIENSGFVFFDESYELIYNAGYEPIYLAGLSTFLYGKQDILSRTDAVNEYFLEEENQTAIDKLYKILILHEPDYIDNFNKVSTIKYDLILAGHSHNGQVRLPFIGALYTPLGAKKYYKPYYKLDKSEMYISSGIGTSTLNFRFFNRPSFNLYRLTNY